MSEACTVADPAGNEKLAKSSEGGRRQKARDDAAAAVLAVAQGVRQLGIYDDENEDSQEESPLAAVARSEMSKAA